MGEVGTCAAAATHLRFEVTGLVFPCCRSTRPLGSIRTQSIQEIWDGLLRRTLRDALQDGDLSFGCGSCRHEVELEGWAGSFPAGFDRWALAPGRTDVWPRRFELNLGNACNLQCVQCDGESSSAIRAHRERRPPLPKVYGDAFFEELATFVPHLDEVVFAGGEPFLIPECYRAWDLIADVDPSTAVTIVTNATQWGPRVESVLERLPVNPVISIDAIRPATYAAIRVGGQLGPVLANTERLAAYARKAGRFASVNFCLMRQNVGEMGELMAWCEERGIVVYVPVVREPAEHSLAQAPPEEIRAARDVLDAEDERRRAELTLNRAAWIAEVERVRGWAARVEAVGARSTGRTIARFPCAGTGPIDDRQAGAALADAHPGAPTAIVTIGEGDRIVACEGALADDACRLVGRPLTSLQDVVGARLGGGLVEVHAIDSTDDRFEAEVVFPAGRVHLVAVPLRDEGGWADHVRYLLSLPREVC
ncbi:MAG: radical SAM protein [Acidimicrobiales bacterium]